MGWLWHNMEPQITTIAAFCDSFNKIWDSVAQSFSQQNNVSRVFELYEKIFTTRQSGKSLPEYYSNLKNRWNELLQYRPFTSDLVQQQQRHQEDFMIASLLFGLNTDLRSFKDQILASETLPTATNVYSRLLRSSLGQHSHIPVSSTPSSESSALVLISDGRGSDFRCSHGGCGFRGSSQGV